MMCLLKLIKKRRFKRKTELKRLCSLSKNEFQDEILLSLLESKSKRTTYLLDLYRKLHAGDIEDILF